MLDTIPSGAESSGLPDSDPSLSSTDVLAFIATVAVAASILEWPGWAAGLTAGLQRFFVILRRKLRLRAAGRNYIRYGLAYDRLSKGGTPGEPTPAQIHPLLVGWRLECERLGLAVGEVTGWKETQNKKSSHNQYNITNYRTTFTRRMLGFEKGVKEHPSWFQRLLGEEDPVKTWKKLVDPSSLPDDD